MMSPDEIPFDDDLMAKAEAAFLAGEVALAAARGEIGRPAETPIDHAALHRHATRRPGDPVDFAVVRLLRTSEAARAALGRMIAARSIAVSPMAWAAADSSATSRRVGDYRLDLEAAGSDGVAAFTLAVEGAARTPTLLRAEWNGRSVAIALPPPDDGLIELYFSEAEPDHADILAVLREPLALIALE